MELDCGACRIRPWELADAANLQRHANDPLVARELRDAFPHPYTEVDARNWIDIATSLQTTNYAIELAGHAIGGIGYAQGFAEARCAAEIGYWLGRDFWGRGLATAAVSRFVGELMAITDLHRLFAMPLARNRGSCRVLEKAGFRREGVLAQSIIKEGLLLDQVMYAKLRSAIPSTPS